MSVESYADCDFLPCFVSLSWRAYSLTPFTQYVRKLWTTMGVNRPHTDESNLGKQTGWSRSALETPVDENHAGRQLGGQPGEPFVLRNKIHQPDLHSGFCRRRVVDQSELQSCQFARVVHHAGLQTLHKAVGVVHKA